jgi:hypothetical protein
MPTNYPRSWHRKARKEAEAEPGVMDAVLLRLLPLIGAERFFDTPSE